jgi:hypothetical protein
MTTSETKTSTNNGSAGNGSWLRRWHRRLGALLAAFILLLSCTGIALNHSSDWALDQRYVTSNWLLDAYGIRAPSASASFGDRDHRVTLLGRRLYLEDREIADDVDVLNGLMSTGDLVLVATRHNVLLLTSDGELVERMDLSTELPGPVDRIGRAGERAVISSEGLVYQANADISDFEPLAETSATDVTWSVASPAPDALLNLLDAQYRGRGLSVERLIADLHSGRMATLAGPYVMDAVALLLIILSITGIMMWLRPRRRNGAEPK